MMIDARFDRGCLRLRGFDERDRIGGKDGEARAGLSNGGSKLGRSVIVVPLGKH